MKVFLKYFSSVIVLCLMLWSSIATAQTLTTNDPPEQKLIELLLKALYAAIVAASPWLTGKLTAGLSNVPMPVRMLISSVIGSTIAGAFGAIPDFPMGVESSMEVGAAGGVVGQWLAQKNPGLFTPKTVQPSPKE